MKTNRQDDDLEEAAQIAARIARATDREWSDLFEQLRQAKQLSPVMRQINGMLDRPEQRAIAAAAIRRMGFEI